MCAAGRSPRTTADYAEKAACLVEFLGDVEVEQVTLREKGDKVRYGFFSDLTRRALIAWLEVRPTDKGGGLFVNLGTRGDGQLTDQGVREMLKRLKRKSGVKGPVNPHSFRHGFAREYLTNGGNLASLADTLGHSDVKVTWASYAVFTFDELKAAHARYSPVARLERDGVI
jgi:site-specific recombinase XerD